MDKQSCSVCKKRFDLDKTGLVGPGGVVVCSAKCAEKSAKSRGNSCTVHNKVGKVVKTNADGTERRHLFP